MMHWQDIYRELQKEGYELALPTAQERGLIRASVQRQHRLNYADAQVRTILVLGNTEKRSKAFFDDSRLTEKLNRKLADLAKPIKEKQPSFQYCGYTHVYAPSAADLVASRLASEQTTIEFIDVAAHEIHRGVFVMWDDPNGKK
jgi:hypothetical protein